MVDSNKFKRVMFTFTVLFFLVFSYIIVADRQAPLTTEGRVHGIVVQVAPEVPGRITKVLVSNNQNVNKGDVLFEIDSEPYQLTLNDALLSLELAKDNQLSLIAQRNACLAGIEQARAHYENAKTEFNRSKELERQKLISRSDFDAATSLYLIADAALEVEVQKLKSIDIQLGEDGSATNEVKMAQNRLEKVNLDMSNTRVKAKVDGVVTNLRLDAGTVANSQVPLLSLVSTDSLWVAADFREKSVTHFDQGALAYVTFDAYPGEVFSYAVESRDQGVLSAQQLPNGTLSNIEINNRWVRDAQRARINLTSEEPLPESLFIGSRATLTLYTEPKSFWQKMAKMQIKLVSLLHYIY